MGLFSKKNEQRVTLPPEPLPVISDTDLADAERIMDQWDAVLGNSDATWDCLELIGRRGGYKGSQSVLMETMDGRDSKQVLQRPWRWWNEAARCANSRGRHALAGRIFLFTQLFVTTIAPKMNLATQMDTGLEAPADQYYKDIAALAVDSLAKLDPGLLIHNTATGKVDVSGALSMAQKVSGLTATTSTTLDVPEGRSVSIDGNQWNTL